MSNIPEFSITELTSLTRGILEDNFNLIRVRGEISSVKNFKGHLYFSLKDENYVLNSVCWASKVPYLHVQPEDGIEVIAEGRISTYAKSSISSYQLQVNQIEVKGEGALLKLIEQRKKKLEIEGIFDKKFKKQIPFLPNKIGVITSSSGSVIMDIIDRIQSRFPTNIKLYSVSVQGKNAATEIVNAIDFFEKNPVDLVIIARGGGGIEDLMPFNEENIVRRVFAFNSPVISAIGHETDFTLLDFVADLRAATPTAAAEMAVPEIKNLKEKNKFLESSLKQSINILTQNYLNFLRNIRSIFVTKNLKKIVEDNKKNIFYLYKNLYLNVNSFVKLKTTDLKSLNIILKSLDIQNTLKRGYVLIKDKSQKFIKNSKSLKKNNEIRIQFYNEEIEAQIKIKK